MEVYVPIIAIMAIYAKENGQGMVFGTEPGAPEPPNPEDPKGASDNAPHLSHKPSLKIVK
jgi:stringent starvation protein B